MKRRNQREEELRRCLLREEEERWRLMQQDELKWKLEQEEQVRIQLTREEDERRRLMQLDENERWKRQQEEELLRWRRQQEKKNKEILDKETQLRESLIVRLEDDIPETTVTRNSRLIDSTVINQNRPSPDRSSFKSKVATPQANNELKWSDYKLNM